MLLSGTGIYWTNTRVSIWTVFSAAVFGLGVFTTAAIGAYLSTPAGKRKYDRIWLKNIGRKNSSYKNMTFKLYYIFMQYTI